MIGVDIDVFNIYAAELSLNSEEDVLNFPEDVVSAGNYSDYSLCKDMMKQGMAVYFTDFKEQLIHSLIEEEPVKREPLVKQKIPAKTYQDIKGNTIKKYILNNDRSGIQVAAHKRT